MHVIPGRAFCSALVTLFLFAAMYTAWLAVLRPTAHRLPVALGTEMGGILGAMIKSPRYRPPLAQSSSNSSSGEWQRTSNENEITTEKLRT